MEEFNRTYEKIVGKEKQQRGYCHDQLKAYEHDNKSMEKDNHHKKGGNEDLKHAIKEIEDENKHLGDACKAALDDLRNKEPEDKNDDLHHKNELRKMKKLILIGDARNGFLLEKIRMLELEKYVFKDADTRARNHFLIDQMDENNERRSILIDAIDAAYHQWLDKLADLKREIN